MSDEKSSLKDQLKVWREDGDELRDLKRPAKAAAKVEPEAAPEPREEELSDEELFQRAVDGVSDSAAAMLGKYDRSDDPVRKRAAQQAEQAPQDADLAMFLQAVGDMKAPPKD